MKTEKQAEKMLEVIDEKTVDILDRKRKEYTKMYNECIAELRFGYAMQLLCLMEIANALGYHWKDEFADRLKICDLKPLT